MTLHHLNNYKHDMGNFDKFLCYVFVLLIAFPIRLWIDFVAFKTFTVLDVYIVSLFVLLFFKFKTRFSFGPNPIISCLLIQLLIACLSIIWSQDVTSSIKYISYSVVGILAYIVSFNLFRGKSINYIANCISAFLILSMLFSLLYWLKIDFIWNITQTTITDLNKLDVHEYASNFARLNHPFLGNSNDYATILALYLFIIIASLKLYNKKLHLLVVILTFTGITLTLSRGVILSVIIAIIVLTIYYKPTIKLLLTIIFVASISLSSLYYFSSYVDTLGINIISDRENSRNIDDRLTKFNYAIKLADDRPLIGYGAGRYMKYDTNSMESSVHNTYLEHIVSYGYLLGSLVILCLFRIAYFYYSFNGYGQIKIMSTHIFVGILTYLIICSNQTSNEAVMPSLLFKIFLGISSSILFSQYEDESE